MNTAPAATPAEAPQVAPAPITSPTPAEAPPVEREPLAHEDPAAAPAPAEAPPAEPEPAAVVPEAAPAAVAPAPVAATGWKGPVHLSPIAIAHLIGEVCRPSVSGEGEGLIARAISLGLGSPEAAPPELARALPQGAMTWKTPSSDGVLYIYGHGEGLMNCGIAVLRPMPEDGFNKVFELLQTSDHAFVSESTQVLAGNVRWARLRSPKGEFVDVMEYPATSEDSPGVLRADFLPH